MSNGFGGFNQQERLIGGSSESLLLHKSCVDSLLGSGVFMVELGLSSSRMCLSINKLVGFESVDNELHFEDFSVSSLVSGLAFSCFKRDLN
jgi:hypothetical protein